MKLKMKELLSCGLVVLGTSAFAIAQSGSPDMQIDTAKLNKHIAINILFPGRTELYRGSESGPSSSITDRVFPKNIKISIPFLDITNADVSDAATTSDTSDLGNQVRETFSRAQDAILRSEDPMSFYPSMTPRHDDPKDKEKITGYSFNRSSLEILENSEKTAVTSEMLRGLTSFEDTFDAMLKQKGLKIDRDHIAIGDSRKIKSTSAEVSGELDSVAGGLFKGDKIENSDDYQWRLNLNQYSLKIEIRLVPLTS
jgi:hypothetical protein